MISPGWASTPTTARYEPGPDAPGWADTLDVVSTLLFGDETSSIVVHVGDVEDEHRRGVPLSPADAYRLADEISRLADLADKPLDHTAAAPVRPRLAPDYGRAGSYSPYLD